ncbi:hypothetical protein CF336_g8146 [Tilletia laevis]|nr:hypothetical protein CF336_g8146 [Tilletia laevis]KAE8185444.1 hypothetical protein CF335_g7719 [Tilletia laevis]
MRLVASSTQDFGRWSRMVEKRREIHPPPRAPAFRLTFAPRSPSTQPTINPQLQTRSKDHSHSTPITQGRLTELQYVRATALALLPSVPSFSSEFRTVCAEFIALPIKSHNASARITAPPAQATPPRQRPTRHPHRLGDYQGQDVSE